MSSNDVMQHKHFSVLSYVVAQLDSEFIPIHVIF